MANNNITFLTNNNGTMILTQKEIDGGVNIHTFHGFYDFSGSENDLNISAGDFVMLLNYYQYVKSNNIQCDFINPNGTNKM